MCLYIAGAFSGDKAQIISRFTGNLIFETKIKCRREFLHISPLIATDDVLVRIPTF